METQISHVSGKPLKACFQIILIAGCCLATFGSVALADDVTVARQVVRVPLFQEQLVWVGPTPPEAQSEILLADVNVFRTKGTKPGFAALEQYVAQNPNSSWTPALLVHLAEHDRANGRYIEALGYWQTAWDETKDSKDPKGKELAVRTIAGWTRLLASLGEIAQLNRLFVEFATRDLPMGTYSTEINETKDGLKIMETRPGESYRCGSYALGHLAMALHSNEGSIQRLFTVDSPDGGFALSELLALAKTNGLDVEAVRRPMGASLVVPSVVHWKLNHYAAITEEKNGRYRVDDPTFERTVWMDEATINAEASGDFILPAGKVPPSWTKLGKLACSKIYGKGYPNLMNNSADTGPRNCDGSGGAHDSEDSNCDPPSANDGPADGGGGNSTNCCGMPQWYVSEPYETVWLEDVPLFYHQSYQKWMELELSYKSRGLAQRSGLPGFGPDWSCNWIGMLEWQPNSPDSVEDYLAGGGTQDFGTDGTPDYMTAREYANVSPPLGTDPPGLVTPTGSENVYGFAVTNLSDGSIDYLLTQRLDRYGRVLEQFNYQTNNGVTQLTAVVDMDGQTNTLSYGNADFPNLITAVTDRYGRTAYFNYDTNGILTNCVDAQGMTNSYRYDANDQLIRMTTPYGTSDFQYYESGNGTNIQLDLGVLVTEANDEQQLYVYRDRPPTDFPDMASYHWNRAEYAAISAAWESNGFDMDPSNYESATIKHWLHGANTDSHGYTVSDTCAQMFAPYNPALGARPENFSYMYQGETNDYTGAPDTDNAVQRVTNIVENGNQLLGITVNTLGRPTSYTFWNYNCNGPNATYINTYDTSGRILEKVVGPQGEVTRNYGYTTNTFNGAKNLLISVTNALGEVTSYTHDPATLKVTSITFPGGLVRTNIYYSSGPYKGFLEMQSDIGFWTNYFTYINGNVYIETNDLGLATVNTYDNLNRLTSTTYPDGTTVSDVYDKLDLAATKDRLNQWTYYGYNQVRQLVAITNVNGQVTAFDYCGCGSPDEIVQGIGANQIVTAFAYDMEGLLTNAIYPDGYQLSYTYDYNSRVSKITDGAGDQLFIESWFQHGMENVPETVSLGGEILFSKQFDQYGNVVQDTDRNNIVVTNGYDLINRLVARQTFSDDYMGTELGLESFGYSPLGLTNYVDQMGRTTFYARDLESRIVGETNANDEALQFAYNPADELVAMTDGKGQTTAWNYDEFGRVTNKVDFSEITNFIYQYDADDRLINRWTPAKGATIYRYDPLGNLTNVDYSGGVTYTPSINFAYDSLNRLTDMRDGVGSTAFTWTPGSQLASETGPWQADTVNYSYNDGRQRSAMSLLQPNALSWAQTYGYDSAMRLVNVTSPAGADLASPSFTYAYAYSLWDRPSSITLPGATQSSSEVTYGYDNFARLGSSQLSTPGAGELLQYTYDSDSEVTQQVFTADNYINYFYDNIGQLTAAQGFDPPTYDPDLGQNVTPPRLQEQFGYTYDKAWNLSQRTNNAMVQSFGVNNVNELTTSGLAGTLTVAGATSEANSNHVAYGVYSVTINGSTAETYFDGSFALGDFTPVDGPNTYTAVAKDQWGRSATNSVTVNVLGSRSYTYDLNGNLTSDGLRNFAYDDENQLISVWVANTWSNSFAYDGLQRKRIEQEFAWNGSAWTQTNETLYIYDGNLVLQERDQNDEPMTTYTRGLDLSGTLDSAGGIGGLLARSDNEKIVPAILDPATPNPYNVVTSYYFNDANGNVTTLLSPSGMTLAQYEYDPFGNLISKSGMLADINKYRFSSKEWNENEGLYYYGYRFYDPNLQRWVNRDPIMENGEINLYGFVLNDPMFWLDLYGLSGTSAAGVKWQDPFPGLFSPPIEWTPGMQEPPMTPAQMMNDGGLDDESGWLFGIDALVEKGLCRASVPSLGARAESTGIKAARDAALQQRDTAWNALNAAKEALAERVANLAQATKGVAKTGKLAGRGSRAYQDAVKQWRNAQNDVAQFQKGYDAALKNWQKVNSAAKSCQ